MRSTTWSDSCWPSTRPAAPPPRPTPAADERPSATRRELLARRIRLLVAATITYNVIEAVVALAEGTRVSSSALIGFGLDSVVEISSAAAVAWQFSAKDPETREKAALRFIAFSFFALAAYVAVDAVRSLLGFGEAAAVADRHRARRGQPRRHAGAVVERNAVPAENWDRVSAVADSKQTLLCTYLSAVLLAGLVLNACWVGRGPTPSPRSVIAAVAVRERAERVAR